MGSNPYRHGSAPSPQAFVAHYVPYNAYAPLLLGAVATICVWGTWIRPSTAPWAGVVVLLLAAAMFPVVTVRARVQGGELVLEGYRWPGPQTLWTCTLPEAADFIVNGTKEGGNTFRCVALRTVDGKICPLTPNAYAGATWRHERVAWRLNGWLDVAVGSRPGWIGRAERVRPGVPNRRGSRLPRRRAK